MSDESPQLLCDERMTVIGEIAESERSTRQGRLMLELLDHIEALTSDREVDKAQLRGLHEANHALLERLTALLNERMDEAEAKIGTRPAHVVVEELERKYAALVEACENLRDVDRSDAAAGGEMWYAEAIGPAVERVVEVLERLGGDTDE